MKKIILVVFGLILTCAVLVGCTQAIPHKSLSEPWSGTETAVYSLKRTLSTEGAEPIMGEQTIITRSVSGESVTIGEKTLENLEGTYISISTTMDDGSTMEAQVAFNANFYPIAAYKKIFVKGHEGEVPATDLTQVISASYDDNSKKYEFTANDNGVEKSDTIKLKNKWIKSPYVDNLMIYHLARSSFLDGAFLPFSFSVPSWSESSLKSYSMAEVKDKAVINVMGIEVSCTQIAISLNQTFPGSGKPVIACYADGAIGEGAKSVRALVKYTEGNMEYTLKSLTL